MGDILVRAREMMAQELFRLRCEAARIEGERVRRQSQGEWLELWRYDAARDVFLTERGDMIAGGVVRADGTSWPFLHAWYEAHPEEGTNA